MIAALSFGSRLPSEELRARFGSRISRPASPSDEPLAPVLRLDWPELDLALPDGGFPRGVVEIASPGALGGGSAIALSAVRAAHRDPRAWCAWIDPEATLHAPGVALSGVDLSRLLVVRPPRGELAKVAVKVAGARAFDVIVVDVDAVPGAEAASSHRAIPARAWPAELLVRKLALAAERGGATIVLLTDTGAPRRAPWPVALRLELSRSAGAFAVRVAKERRGRVGLVKTVPLGSRPTAWRDTTLETGSLEPKG